MQIGEYTVPVAVLGLAVAALAAMAASLVDLSRHDVRHLPKWAWGLIIVLVNFPVGAIVYFVVGRVSPGGQAHGGAVTPPGPGAPLRSDAPRSRVQPSTDDGGVVVSTTALYKAYGDAAALDGVDLRVVRGVIYGLIGPNGAGKTTLLSVLAGLRRPTRGRLELGVPRTSMGVLVDTPQFEPWLTAWEVVDLARHLTAPDLPHTRAEEVLTEVGLTPVIDRRVGGFSRGMLQRLGLAACLVGDPEVLLLDEPSSALDPAGRREVLDLVSRLAQTKTVILSTHILSDVQQVADVVGVIDRGALRFQGPLADLLAHTSTAYSLHVRPPAGRVVDHLRHQTWVDDVTEQTPGRIRITVSDAGRAEREIPRLLALHELQLVSFNPATDLETAFLELTT